METITDWKLLWKELVEIKRESQKESIETPGDSDHWCEKARAYDKRVKIKWEKPDSSRILILSVLEPNSTLVDIGAGTGAWSILFSKTLSKVTAVEPSRAMREVLIENIRSSEVKNIRVLPEGWLECSLEKHDYTFCSHAMYGETDFVSFVQKMIEHSNKMCFLLIRNPSDDGLIAEACQHIWNQPYDSPNFTIAYNILLQMGIHANVQFEESGREFFICNSGEHEALIEIKKRMGLLQNGEYDGYLQDLLHRRLVKKEDQFYWPGGGTAALIYWSV